VRRPNRTMALVLAACGLAALARAQAAPARQAPSEPAFMDQPPAVGPFKPYRRPVSESDQLPNGLKIVVAVDHRFPLVSVRMAFRAGDSRLTPADAGLADAEADLLTEGTPTRTALQIAQAQDAMGGGISAGVDPDFLTISASALSDRVYALFQLLSDVVLHSDFPEKEVALEKANMLQALRANRASAGFLASVEFNKLLFAGNPYAITTPTAASIAAITRAKLLQFHRDYFLPNNQAEIVITGDISAARAHNLAQQFFGEWRIGNPKPPPAPPVKPPRTRRIYLIARPGSAQSTILLGNLGLIRSAANYFPFRVANEVLGGSFNSRLTDIVRERMGYAYDIGSQNVPYRKLGAWIVSTQVRTAVTAPALAAILTQLQRIRSAPVTPQELTQAKNYLTGNYVLSLETQADVADWFLTTGIYGLPPSWMNDYVASIQGVTAGQALAAARAVIHPGHIIVVVVGDVQRIEAGLAKLAPGTMLTIYNDRGDVVGTYPPEGPPKGHADIVH
jgi:zinc protease